MRGWEAGQLDPRIPPLHPRRFLVRPCPTPNTPSSSTPAANAGAPSGAPRSPSASSPRSSSLGLAITFLIPPILPNLQAAKTAVRITRHAEPPHRHARRRAQARRPAATPRRAHAQARAAGDARRAPARRGQPRRGSGARHAEIRAQPAAAADRRRLLRELGRQLLLVVQGARHRSRLGDRRVGVPRARAAPGSRSRPTRRSCTSSRTSRRRTGPRVFAMVSNFDGNEVRRRRCSAACSPRRASRQAAAIQLVDAAQKYGFAGITIDFEEVPDDLLDPMFEFMRYPSRGARARRAPAHVGRRGEHRRAARAPLRRGERLRVPHALRRALRQRRSGPRREPVVVRREGEAVAQLDSRREIDPRARRLRLRLERRGPEAQPAASSPSRTRWSARRRRARRSSSIPCRSIRTSRTRTRAGADHVAWFLDGVTAWNQTRAGVELGAAGSAIWRLGSEDPSIWHGISNDVPHGQPQMLEDDSRGLRSRSSRARAGCCASPRGPPPGRRLLQSDPKTQIITHESITQFPSPWVVQRFGSSDPGKVAITFDDGPDPRYTNAILDTLASRDVEGDVLRRGAAGGRVSRHREPHPPRRARDRQPHVHASEPRAHQRVRLEARDRRDRPPHRDDHQPAHRALPSAVLRRRRPHLDRGARRRRHRHRPRLPHRRRRDGLRGLAHRQPRFDPRHHARPARRRQRHPHARLGRRPHRDRRRCSAR